MVIIFFVCLDRVLKALAVGNFFNPPIEIISDWLKLNFVGNTNIAFSLPVYGEFLSVVILIIIISLLYYFIFFIKRKEISTAVWVMAVILGAVSNYFDRIKYGYVIDYFDFKYFTVFNLADAMIVIGAIFILLANKKAR